jgi:hypothetical protein
MLENEVFLLGVLVRLGVDPKDLVDQAKGVGPLTLADVGIDGPVQDCQDAGALVMHAEELDGILKQDRVGRVFLEGPF